MAKNIGRKFLIKRNGTEIAAVRTKSFTINNEAIDVTTDDSSGYRTLLETPGQKQIDMSVEGLTEDYDLVQTAVDGSTLIETYTIEFPNGDTIEGDFRFNNLEIGAEYNAASTFTAEIQSTGAYTYAAAV